MNQIEFYFNKIQKSFNFYPRFKKKNCFKKLKTKFVPHINDGIHQFKRTFYFILLQIFHTMYTSL